MGKRIPIPEKLQEGLRDIAEKRLPAGRESSPDQEV
jgi:hypothetical protein